MSSARQRRLWLLEKLGALPDSARVAGAARCTLRVDAQRLAQCFEEVLGAEPLFRARFTGERGTKIELDQELPAVQVQEVSGSVREAAEAWLSSQPPFQMRMGGLIRCAVLVNADETAIVVNGHRAVADSWTLDRLIAQVLKGFDGQAREAITSGLERCELEPAAELKQQAVAAVRKQLSEVSEPVELIGDRPRPVVQDQRTRSSVHELDELACDAARALARSFELGEEAVLLAAFTVLVGRYTRKRDVLIGRHVHGRGAGELAFGPFDNDVVFRCSLGGARELSVRDFMRAVEQELAREEPLERVPFESVLEELALARDASRAPVFQIGFRFGVRTVLPGGWAYLDLQRRGSAMDLMVEVETAERADGLVGAKVIVTEAEGLFTDAARAARLVGHLNTLLVAMAQAPDQAIDFLPLVGEEERALLTRGVNPNASFACDDSIATRVQRAARARPDSIAVVCGEDRLTYGELEKQATRLARRLRELGVGRDDRVGVCMERSTRLIVALYAILKAGGAYVPVEPTQPKDRAEFVLSDAEPKVVLVEGETLADTSAPLLRLDTLQDELLWLSEEPLEPAPGDGSAADALAYIIYTSGSTGRPKGCLVDNRHVVRLLDATQDWFHFDDRDVWTMFHSVAFDFSVWEIWGALTYGGKLVVVPYSTSRSPDEFRRLASAEGVTVLNQTPSAFRQFIEADARDASRPLALRYVIFGGEALELESLRPWFQRYGDKRPKLVNMYGITETTVHVTYRPLSWADLDAGYASVIGVPIPDLRCYVVDEALNLLPIGVPGELLVAGAGVSRGYWKRPELTEQRFVPDGFSGETGKLYRSGDLVRRLPSGELDYLGRIDQQVKIRGFRIETGEVESALRRSGLVRDVSVLAAKKPTGETVLVAYVVTSSTPHEIRLSVRTALPEYMVPSVFVPLPAIPMTGNGKVDRRALPDPWQAAAQEDEQYVPPRGRFEQVVAQAFAEVLHRPRVSATCHFFDSGGTSLEAVTVAQRIGAQLSVDVPVVKVFEHTTVEALARFLEYEQVVVSRRAPQKSARAGGAGAASSDQDIAVIAVSGRFPGAEDVGSMWKNLLDGKESITYFEPRELDPALDPGMTQKPTYVRARGILSDPAGFDAPFFAMPPREAEVTDPQQRLALELAWEALESGGYDPSNYPGTIGVYCGEYNVSYYVEHVLKRPDVLESVGTFLAMLGNEKDFIATRIAHKLDLKGPAISVHTGCSTSLVAVVQAFHALRTGQCDMALAGGVAITCPPHSGYVYEEGGMLSPDGHTRAFDSKAQGTVFSDGGAFVLLKRLSDALRDGDSVLAVLRGAATNNDGSAKMSFTAPSAAGQAEVVEKALAVSGVDPSSIGYVETHGTGTPLGDPIEIEGLTRAFRRSTEQQGYCGIGSIKSNFGHLVAAAGAAGLIKTVLAVRSGVIPPTLHFESPNPRLNLERSPFYVVSAPAVWPEALSPRRAGVSSFGVGGTNAHVVLEEPPVDVEQRPPRRDAQLLLLSARSPSALDKAARRLAGALASATPVELADAAYTLAVGRRAFPIRRFVVVKSGEEAVVALSAGADGNKAQARPALAFAFSGQGSQYVAMGRALSQTEPVFRLALERCIGILRSGVQGPGGPLDCDLSAVLDPSESGREHGDELLLQTAYTQPALFAVEYALAELWKSLGITPEYLLGHSIGEIVAACVSGVLSLEDALRVVLFRGRLMQSAPRGVMLSVRAAASEIAADLGAELGIAAVNAPKLCVVSGPEAAIENFEQRMVARNVATTRLRTSHAFHSPMMDGAVQPFLDILRGIHFSAPKIPIVSTVTGRVLTAEEAMDPVYWAQHLRKTVRFADALSEVWRKSPECILLEIGPRATLATLGRQIAEDTRKQLSLPSLDVGAKLPSRGDPDEQSALLQSVGTLWSQGVAIDFGAFFEADPRRRVPLPTYPFERQRYWIDAPAHLASAPTIPGLAAPVSQRLQAAPASEAPSSQARPSWNMAQSGSRKGALLDALRQVFEEASGMRLGSVNTAANFNEIGLDSLSLTQCAQLVSKRTGCAVTFRQLSEQLCSLDRLVAYLDENLPVDAYRVAAEPGPAAAAAAAAVIGLPSALGSAPSAVALESAADGEPNRAQALRILAQQMDLMTQQLEMLRKMMGVLSGEATSAPPPSSAAQVTTLAAVKASGIQTSSRQLSEPSHEAVTTLQATGTSESTPGVFDASTPPVPGAKLGRDRDGNPAWFVPHPDNPKKYVKLG